MVVVDPASKISQGVRIFTLDTGRLPQETFQMMDVMRERYGAAVEILRPGSFYGPCRARESAPRCREAAGEPNRSDRQRLHQNRHAWYLAV